MTRRICLPDDIVAKILSPNAPSIRTMEKRFGISRSYISRMRRAHFKSTPPPVGCSRTDDPPMSAGHAVSWSALWKGLRTNPPPFHR